MSDQTRFFDEEEEQERVEYATGNEFNYHSAQVKFVRDAIQRVQKTSPAYILTSARKWFFASRFFMLFMFWALAAIMWSLWIWHTRTAIISFDVAIRDEDNAGCAAALQALGFLTDDDGSNNYCHFLEESVRRHSISLLGALGASAAAIIFTLVNFDTWMHAWGYMAGYGESRFSNRWLAKIGFYGVFESVYFARIDGTLWLTYLGFAPFIFFLFFGIVGTQNEQYMYHGALLGGALFFAYFLNEIYNTTIYVSAWNARVFSSQARYNNHGPGLLATTLTLWITINSSLRYAEMEDHIEVPGYVTYFFIIAIIYIWYLWFLKFLNHIGLNTRSVARTYGTSVIMMNLIRWFADYVFVFLLIAGTPLWGATHINAI